MGDAQERLTVDGYCLKIGRVISLLEDDTALREYPSLTHLLNRKRRGHGTNRDLLVTLLEHMRTTVRQNPSEAIYDSAGRITAYAITISIRFLGTLWGMRPETANKTIYLFTATGLVNRRQTKSEQARELSRQSREATDRENNAVLGLDAKSRQHYMYTYWADGWTKGQLQEKDRRAEKQQGKTTGLQRTDVITIHGQRTATAISENGSGKSKKQLQTERRVKQAYESIVSRTGQAVVTKAEILEELKKTVPRRLEEEPTQAQETERRWRLYEDNALDFRERYPQWGNKEPTREAIAAEVGKEYRNRYTKRLKAWPEIWWKKGALALMTDYSLVYRPLRKEEKQIYGDTGRAWVLLWEYGKDIPGNSQPEQANLPDISENSTN